MYKINQTGRSMIEMLGVLAIIGVLSIGGIAGYSNAMKKYKINKAVEEITHLSQNIRRLYANQKSYLGIECNGNNEDEGCKIIKKANLAPEEMYQNQQNQNLIYDPWGNEVSIWVDDKYASGSDNKAFIIYFDMYNKQDICIELMSQDWSSLDGLVAVGGNPGDEVVQSYYGCEGSYDGGGNSPVACLGGRVLSVPMPISYAIKACENNDMALKFY